MGGRMNRIAERKKDCDATEDAIVTKAGIKKIECASPVNFGKVSSGR